jgi:hypothetical protein
VLTAPADVMAFEGIGRVGTLADLYAGTSLEPRPA